jgi:uncharacterized membrane protein YccC
VWSTPAALRALRAALVVPGLFALTFKVIGDVQMTLFATFGGFATLVLASFGGSRRERAIAHLGLAVAGTAALAIGTAASGVAWLAALVTIPVTFLIFFAGVCGPNAASGVTAALLAYILPVATTSPAATVPARLAGWWLASVVGTAAVLLLSPRPAGDRLRGAAAASAGAVSRYLAAGVRGEPAQALREASLAAKHELMAAFGAAPYRPTGLATADQALASLVQLLEWCASLASDALDGHLHLSQASAPDRELLGASAEALAGVAALLDGRDAAPDTARLERARAASAAHQRSLPSDRDRARGYSEPAFHAQVIAVTVLAAVLDALVAARRADQATIDAQRRLLASELGTAAPRRSSPAAQRRSPAAQRRRWPAALTAPGGLASAAWLVMRHASLRSVWFRNSARGAVALAAAVAVADLTGVQHGFWVVLGTLSVLRSNAAATGATAWRALAGTVVGFAAGAALLLAIGTGQAALWVALPLAVLVAAYTPGTAPFLLGQAAFTITVVVLFNLLVPAGWKVGLLRIEDVALGCAVSLVVGVMFWPRGAGAVVGDDLADAFRRGGSYVAQAVDWSLGSRPVPPDAAVPAVTAGIRLDDAIRGYLAEQGSKRISKTDLWSLVMGTLRVRLTASSLASVHVPGDPPQAGPGGEGQPGQGQGAQPGDAGQAARGDGDRRADRVRAALRQEAAELAGFYDRIAVLVGPPGQGEAHGRVAPVTAPELGGAGDGDGQAEFLWVREHLRHLGQHAQAITEPAAHLAIKRREQWWR